MNVLLYEPKWAGHHLQFVHYLARHLLGIGTRVTLCTTARACQSPDFQKWVASLTEAIHLDSSLEDAPPELKGLKRRQFVWSQLELAARRAKADYVIGPSGDDVAGIEGLAGVLRWKKERSTCGEVVLHGRASYLGRRAWLLEAIGLFLSRWRRIHYINVLDYERVRRVPLLRHRVGLMAVPTKQDGWPKQEEARSALGLPMTGHLLTVAGIIDHRKALEPLLAGVRDTTDKKVCLLLAGRISRSHRNTIRREYQSLLDEGRLILLNRFLSDKEYRNSISASDWVVVLQPDQKNISCALLDAVAAHRRVIASEGHWIGRMVLQFGLGLTCDARDPAAVHEGIERAFKMGNGVVDEWPEPARRLMKFHSVENYSELLTAGIRKASGQLKKNACVDWDWVTKD